MGNAMICGYRSSSVVTIVHMNGFVEEFPLAMTAKELTLDYPHHCLFTTTQPVPLPLPDHAQLHLGHVYFLLPNSHSHPHSKQEDLPKPNPKQQQEVNNMSRDLIAQMVAEVQMEMEKKRKSKTINVHQTCRSSWQPSLETIQECPTPTPSANF